MAKEYKVKILKSGEKRYIFDVNIGYRTDGSRIRTTITAKTVKEGRQKVAELTLQKTNKMIIDKNTLFCEVYDKYISNCEKKFTLATLDNIKFNYRLKYTRFKNTKLNKIKDIDLIEWIDLLKNIYQLKL